MGAHMHHPAGCRLLILTAAGALVSLAPVGGHHATASTVTGKITGAPIPTPGTGQAFARAVSVQTGTVVATDDTDAAGRYKLTVPGGTFVLLPTVITLNTLFAPKPTRVRLKSGRRASVRLPARGNAVVLQPVVGMPDSSFTGAAGDLRGLNRGLRDMLTVDLLEAKLPGCEITISEQSAFGLAMIKQEFTLARLGLTDPATTPRPGRTISPTRGIRGTFTVTGGRMRIDAEVYKWSSKTTLHRTAVEGAQEEFFALEADLTRRLAALLCKKKPPISGTFTGSIDYAQQVPVGVLQGKLDWNGSVQLEPATSPGGIPPQFGGATTVYRVTSGTLTASIRITTATGECTISGQGTFDIAAMGGSQQPMMTITEGDPDTYQLALGATTEQIPAVLTACPPDKASSNGNAAPWPLLGILLLPSSRPPFPITAEGAFSGSATGTTPGTDKGYQWTWGLQG